MPRPARLPVSPWRGMSWLLLAGALSWLMAAAWRLFRWAERAGDRCAARYDAIQRGASPDA